MISNGSLSSMRSSDASSLRTLVGICAYNEEYNISRLLRNLLAGRNLPNNSRIMVICSGCTDRTPQIIKEFCEKDARIKPVVEKFRKGKANALNKIFAKARECADILILVNADALPEQGSIEKLILQLEKKTVGAVFARPVPLNELQGISNRIVHIVWKLHHNISVHKAPKLSAELCAIRTICLRRIPEDIATDEPFIELSIRQQGYRILYVPEAVVYIRCPRSVPDLFRQRKRIWIGHLQIRRIAGFVVPTSSLRNTVWSFSTLRLSEIPYALLGAFIESFAYLVARLNLSKGRVPHVWEPIKSTKISV